MGDLLSKQQLCEYPFCKKPLDPTRFRKKKQRYCDAFCAQANNRHLWKLKLKTITAIKHDAEMVYNAWKNSGIPIYRLTALDQLRVKFYILDYVFKVSKKEQRLHAKLRNARYRQKHLKRLQMFERERYHFTRQLKFAKFWKSVES